MQGEKKFTSKLFVNFRLDEAIPDDNFYKILKKNLNLDFIYKETKSVYSHTQKHRPKFEYDGRRNAFIYENKQILKPVYSKFAEERSAVI